MLFPTIRFALFFSIVLPLSWLLMRRRGFWKGFICLASYVFYAFAAWDYVFLLAFSTLGNQAFALVIDRSRTERARRWWLVGGVALNVGLLAYFKYYDFFANSANNLFADFGFNSKIPLYNIALPAAISFFTFQALSYVIDTYRGKIRPAGLLDFAVYLSFFPHLIAGPIVRAAEFLPQLKTKRDPRRVDAGLAFWLLAMGLFKKVVVSTYLATKIVDPVYKAPGQHSGLDVILATYGYAVQIYMDFSGYTDMAIGLALLMGFRFPQNFDAPYSASSLQDFWRRWHMTLSRWLRDYLYVPLGGNRRGKLRGYINLMATMVLGGLWHGAGWLFFIWGAIHGVYLAIERFASDTWAGHQRKREEQEARTLRNAAALATITGVPQIGIDSPPPVTRAQLGGGGAPATAEAAHGASSARSLAGDGNQVGLGTATLDPPTGRAGSRTLPPDGDGAAPISPDGHDGSPSPRGFVPGGGGDGHDGHQGRASSEATTVDTRTPHGAWRWARWFLTFQVVCAAWVFFKVGYDEGNLSDAIAVFERLAHWGSLGPINPMVVAVIVISIAVQFTPVITSGRMRAAFSDLHWAVQGALLGAWMTMCSLFLVLITGGTGIAPFIYFKF